jgi:hypothetical protein
MNESTSIQLKIMVERAVRPVLASSSRKRKIREELLAHVTAVFEEEKAKLGQDQAALDRTAQRFGGASELTRQLQESVPRVDAWDRFGDDLGGPANESALGRAARFGLLSTLLGSILALIVLFLVWPLGTLAKDLRLLVFSHANQNFDGMLRTMYKGVLLNLIATGVSLFVLTFTFTLQTEWLRLALYGPSRRRWHRVALAAAAFCPIIPVLLLTFGLTLSGTGLSVIKDWPWTVLCSIMVWALMLPSAQSGDRRIRYHEEWAGLQIDAANFRSSRSAAN